MRKYWILTRLQLMSLMGINKLLHMKKSEERKKRTRGIVLLLVIVVAFVNLSVTYSAMLASVLEPFGALPLMLKAMAFSVSLLILLFSVFEVKGTLYAFGDYDVIMSWPVSVRTVSAARLTNMYAFNLFYALILLAPAGVVYAMHAEVPALYWPLLILGVLAVPVLPTLIGALLGTLLTIATARAKKSGLLGSIGQILLAIGIMALSMRLNFAAADPDALYGTLSGGKAFALYPPVEWFTGSVTAGNPLPMLLLLVVSAAGFMLMVLLLSRSFVQVNSHLKSAPRSKTFRMHMQAGASAVRALYRKEWKRYVGTSIYLTNTAFGYVLLLLLSIVVCFVRPATMVELIADPTFRPLLSLAPFLMAWFMMMSSTTSSSISLEGKNLWIIKSMPVSMHDLLLSKLLVSLTLAAPCAVVCGAMIGIGLSMDVTLLIWTIVTPLAFAVFAGVMGLWINLKLPKFDWSTETEVVKQSMATFITVFGSMLVSFAFGALAMLFDAAWVLPAATVFVLAAAWLIWKLLIKNGDRLLYRL